MDYAMIYILAIMFWTLAAIAVVCLMTFAYCNLMYYKWNREQRQKTSLVKTVHIIVNKVIDQMQNMNVEEIDREQYGDFENDEEAEASMMQDY